MVINGDGDGGGSVAGGEVGCRRGVLVLEDMALGLTLRLARRNVKNAVKIGWLVQYCLLKPLLKLNCRVCEMVKDLVLLPSS
jgi:hypothetical protein